MTVHSRFATITYSDVLLSMRYILPLVFLLAACGTSPQSTTFKRLDGTTVDTDSVTSQLQILMRAHHVPGLSVALIREGEIVYAANIGDACQDSMPADSHTVFAGASFSKPMFASMILAQSVNGSPSLDTVIDSLIPQPLTEYEDYTELAEDTNTSLLTLRRCLCHTTGLPNWRWIFDEDMLRFHYPPGERFEYSGEGFQIAQLVFNAHTGQDLEAYAQKTLFQPLSMQHSSYVWQARWEGHAACRHLHNGKILTFDVKEEPSAAGSLSSQAYEIALWLRALMKDLPPFEGVLGMMMQPQVRISNKQMFGPNRLKPGPEHAEYNLAWGLGWGLFDSPYGPVAFHTGHDSGVQNLMLVFPKSKSALVLMTNSDTFEPNAAAFLEATLGFSDAPLAWLYGSNN